MESVRGREHDPEGVVDVLTPMIESRDAFSDVPIPGLYRQLATRWPDSRFILVTREPQDWARSVQEHLRQRRLSPYNRIQYLPYLPRSVERITELGEKDLIAVHEQHTAQVERFFQQELGHPERLCSVDIKDGDVGERICNFLGLPSMSLPHLSGRPSERDLEVSWRWVEMCPRKSDAHYFLAKNLRHFGRFKEAEHHLRVATEVEPDQPKPYAELSELLWREGRRREASELASLAIDWGLLRRRLYYRAALGKLIQGDWGRAVGFWLGGVRQSRN